jgi:hypothetical protein
MNIKKIRKAEKWEVDFFRKQVDDLHPLEYVAEIRRGPDIMIEGLHEGPGGPQYEAMAPEGHHFGDGCGERLHGLVCFSLKDVRGRLTDYEIEKCDEECDKIC